jgi:hypothetical protein
MDLHPVERIERVAVIKGQLFFRVHWRAGDKTWEPIKQVNEGVPDLVQEFVLRLNNQDRKRQVLVDLNFDPHMRWRARKAVKRRRRTTLQKPT